jgi:hypothetical protein
MKKALALLPLLVLLSAASWGASTPTFTSTVTLTPTPTYTPTPLAVRDQRFTRVYIQPRDLRGSDSISTLATTPAASTAYLAQNQNMASCVFAVATPGTEPEVRLKWTVPQDYAYTGRPIQLWLTGYNGTAVTTTTMVCNVYRMKRAGKSDNIGTAAVQSMLGVTTNVQTLDNSYSLAQVTYTAKRFKVIMPTAVTQCAAGDELSFQVQRVAGLGALNVFTVEIEYDRKNYLNP